MSSGKKDKFSNTPAFDRVTQMITGNQFGPDLMKAAMKQAELSQRAMSQAIYGISDPSAEALQRSQKLDAMALDSIKKTMTSPAICKNPPIGMDMGGMLPSKDPIFDQKLMEEANNRIHFDDYAAFKEMGKIRIEKIKKISDLKVKYESHTNPLCALDALNICIIYGEEIPDWVTDYLRNSLRAITGILIEVAEGGEAGKEADRVGRAFGFGTRGRGRNSGWFSQMTTQKYKKERNFEIYEAVNCGIKREYTDKNGNIRSDKLEYVCFNVAEKYEISAKTVMKIYRDISNELKEQDIPDSSKQDDPIP